MTLNMLQLSRAFNLLVARQFRINFHNANKGQVRTAHTGSKSGSCKELPPVATRSLTKNPVTQVKICRPRIVSSSATNLHSDFKVQKMTKLLKERKGETNISRNKRSEIVDWIGHNGDIRSDHGKIKNIKIDQLLTKQNSNNIEGKVQSNKESQLVKSTVMTQPKPVDGRNSEKNRINEDLLKSIANTAKDLLKWIDAVRKHSTKLEQAAKVQKTTDYMMANKLSNKKMSQKNCDKKVYSSQCSLNLPISKTAKTSKIFADNLQQLAAVEKVGQNVERDIKMSDTARDLNNINQDISRLRRKKNIAKDSTRFCQEKAQDKSKKSQAFLEIRPTYIQNIVKDAKVGLFKKTDLEKMGNNASTVVANKAGSKVNLEKINNVSGQEKGFILVNTESRQIDANRFQDNSKSKTLSSEKGFVMIDSDCEQNKGTPFVCPGEKGDCTVSRDSKCENLARKMEQENASLANAVNNMKTSETNSTVDRTNGALVCNESLSGVSRQDVNGKYNAVSKEMFTCTTSYGMKDKHGCKQTVNTNQGQLIGSSDSSDELHPPLKVFNTDGDRSSILVDKVTKGNVTGHDLSRKRELQKSSKVLRKKVKDLPAGKTDISEKKRIKYKTSAKRDEPLKANNHKITERVKITEGISDNAAEDVIEERVKQQLQPLMELKNIEVKDTKRSAPSVDRKAHEQAKTVPRGTTTKSGDGQKATSPRKNSATAHDKGDSKTFMLKSTKTPTEVHELKPDFRETKNSRSSQIYGQRVTRCKSEPQLCVKPEELSKSLKQTSKSTEIKLFLSPPISATTATTDLPVAGLSSKSPMTTRSMKTDPEVRHKVAQRDRKEAGAGTPERSPLGKNDKALLIDTSGSSIVKHNTPLPELFCQKQQSKSAINVSTKKAAHQSCEKEINNARKIGTNNEIIRTRQEQFSEGFQNKCNNNKEDNPYLESNVNCFVAKAQDSNSSSGNKQDSYENNLASDSKSRQASSLSWDKQLLLKKSEHFPTMGMAQRLMLASETSLSVPEISKKAPSEVTFSDSSMTNDITASQALSEVDELPELDQLEEWMQNNTPEVFKDDKIKPSVGKDIQQSPGHGTTDNLRLPSKGKPVSSSDYEGSSVDGPLSSEMSNKYSNSHVHAKAKFEKGALFNLFSEGKPTNDDKTGTTIRKTGAETMPRTLSKDSYCFRPRGVSVSASRNESVTGISKLQKSLSTNQYQSGKNILSTAVGEDSRSTSNKNDVLSTLAISNKQQINTDSKFKNAKTSNFLNSMDGFVSMTLIQEPAESPIKPTLKRIKPRDRSEEKRVTFVNGSSKNDNYQTEFATGETNKVKKSFESSVDRILPRLQPAGDKVIEGNDLRKDLAEERKRSEMEDRIKLIQEHTKQIRDYEAALFKYRNIIEKIEADSREIKKVKGTNQKPSSEI